MESKLWENWLDKYANHISTHNSKELAKQYDDKYQVTFIKNDTYFLSTQIDTAKQPKQIVYNSLHKVFIVSCMKGKRIQIFKSLEDKSLKLFAEIKFDKPCVELATDKDLIFVTLSNFTKLHKDNSELAIVDINTNKIISKISTGGQWSKVIKILPNKKLLIISNWKSNDLSVITYEDPFHPKLLRLINCGTSPRGIDALKDESMLYVACYYSRNIIELSEIKNQFNVTHITPPYDYPNYSGNMRDITIDNKYAYVTNMGRNCVLKYSLEQKEICKYYLVGKYQTQFVK